MNKIEYYEDMLEEVAINKYLNMIANDYNGELAKTFQEKYINKDKEIERLNNIKKKAINELFNLKDMIYKPETREINFDIQNKISSIIKILGSDKE